MALRSGPLGTLKVQVKTFLRGPRRASRPVKTSLDERWSTASPWAQSTPAALRASRTARPPHGPTFFRNDPFADDDDYTQHLGGSHGNDS